MDMNLMLIIVQENDAESLASAFKRSQIQATRIDAKGLVSSRKLNVFLVGTERTDEVLQLVSSNCKERAMEIEDQEDNGICLWMYRKPSSLAALPSSSWGRPG